MLGVWFDTVEWIWWISEEKVLRYCNDLTDMLGRRSVTQREVWESVGKILYVSQLIPESKYHISELLRMNNISEDGNHVIVITRKFKRQAKWWIPFIRLAGEGLPIPPSHNVCPPDALIADSDAAGGSLRGRPGCGIVFGRAWSVVSWPDYVNRNDKCICGSGFKHKLTFLELVGHLLHVTVFPEVVLDRSIATNIDNSGTVVVADKGRSTRCQLTDCLVNTINHVAVALGTRAYVRKIRRCSTAKAEAADALSKNDLERFRRLVPDSEELPRVVPRSVLTWLQKPYVDFDLGRKIVAELKVNGINVYDSMM